MTATLATPRPAVLITGAAKRLGRAMALHLAQAGYDIALHYNQSRKDADSLAHEIVRLGREVALLKADLREKNFAANLVRETLAAFPNCRYLVNNAAVFEQGAYPDADQNSFDLHMETNLRAPIMLTREFAKVVSEGAVVNIIDSRVHENRHSYFYYQLSKKAFAGFTQMAAAELGPGLRVNGVCPGFILPSDGFGSEYQQQREVENPLQRIATPDEVAAAVHFFLENKALTGQFLYVDGGSHLL